MAEDLFGPEVSPGDLVEDDDDIRAPRPLSWDRRNLHVQVADPGWKNKFNLKMVVQVGLSVMYAIIYGISFTRLNPYYKWPLTMDSTGEVVLESVLTDEEAFVCEGTKYFLNETGPILDSATKVVYSNSTHELLLIMGQYWGISIAFFVIFIIARLCSGRYNQLLLLVQFGKDEDGEVKPAKLSFAFTIMCNAKSFSSTVFKDLCDRMATDNTDYLSLVFLLAWCFLMLLTFYWIFTCCGGCKCLEFRWWTQEKQFLWFRGLVICNTIIMFITWIVSFNPSIQFNPKTPVLYFTNVVSWCDLGISVLGDIYEYLNGNLCFGCIKHPATSLDVEKGKAISPSPHSKTAVSTDSEDDEDYGGDNDNKVAEEDNFDKNYEEDNFDENYEDNYEENYDNYEEDNDDEDGEAMKKTNCGFEI